MTQDDKKIGKEVRVLIVEDDRATCQVFSSAFMKRGFKVYTAFDGEVAIEKFKRRAPHVVLLDVKVPGHDGHRVLKEIRKDLNAYVPVIMLTNVDVKDFAKQSSLEQIDAYVTKSEHGLQEVIEKTVEVLEKNKVSMY